MYQNSYVSDEEEEEDDWFYNSIKRYDDLLMYEFQGKVSSAAFHSADKLIATCLNTNGRQEILELAVPDRLVAEKDAGLVKNRDFSVVSAGYLKSEASCVVPYDNVLITSEGEGVHLYNIPNHCDTDLIAHNRLIRKLANPQIHIDTSKELFSGSTLSDIKTHSIETGKELKDLSRIPLSESLKKNHSISFLESRSNDLIIGCNDIGLLLYIDIRSDAVRTINLAEKNYKWAYNLSSDGKIGIINTIGIFHVFDKRNLSKEILKIASQFDILEENGNLLKIHFDPSNSFVSVSGFDKSVKVYSLQSAVKDSLRFTHDGHKKCSYVSGHIWHSSLVNVIFSYDDTGALQAWKFR